MMPKTKSRQPASRDKPHALAVPTRVEIPVMLQQALGYRVLKPTGGHSLPDGTLLDGALLKAVDALGAKTGDVLLVILERRKGDA